MRASGPGATDRREGAETPDGADAVQDQLVRELSDSSSLPAAYLNALQAEPSLIDQLDSDHLQHDDPLAAHEDETAHQPEPEHGAWVCDTLHEAPLPKLAAVADSLTRAEAEADAGDRLGPMVVSGLSHTTDVLITGEHIFAGDVVADAAGTAEVHG